MPSIGKSSLGTSTIKSITSPLASACAPFPTALDAMSTQVARSHRDLKPDDFKKTGQSFFGRATSALGSVFSKEPLASGDSDAASIGGRSLNSNASAEKRGWTFFPRFGGSSASLVGRSDS